MTTQADLFAEPVTVPFVGLETMTIDELWNLKYRISYQGASLVPMPHWSMAQIDSEIQRRGV